jgi:hypothetical protein
MNPSNRSESKPDEAIGRFIILLLFQAQKDKATELVIGVASPGGKTPLRYKAEEAWHDMPPFPSHIRPAVISEIARMANFPAGQIPGQGALDVSFGKVRLRWIVAMTRPDGECMLARVQD